jgi:hypothetical protein
MHNNLVLMDKFLPQFTVSACRYMLDFKGQRSSVPDDIGGGIACTDPELPISLL